LDIYLEADYVIHFVWKSYLLELHYVLCTLFNHWFCL